MLKPFGGCRRIGADLADIRDYIAERVIEGFDTREEIIEAAADYANDIHHRVDLDWFIEQTTDALLEAHYLAERRWPLPTDCDRLDSAFARLESEGILARQDFACCQNCGHTELWDELQYRLPFEPAQGYVFYHMQDTEAALQGDRLYLAYGSATGDEAALAEIGWCIVGALRESGLMALWDGNVDRCIQVEIDWKRRRMLG